MNARRIALKELKKSGFVFRRHGVNHDIYFHPDTKRIIPLKRHDFDEDDLRYLLAEIREYSGKDDRS